MRVHLHAAEGVFGFRAHSVGTYGARAVEGVDELHCRHSAARTDGVHYSRRLNLPVAAPIIARDPAEAPTRRR